MKKRFLSVLLALALCLSLLPTMAFAVSDSEAGTWDELAEELGNNNLVKLTKDIVLPAPTDDPIAVTGNVTIDLNGYVLDLNGNSLKMGTEHSSGPTIQDSDPVATHTGSYADLPAGGCITGNTGGAGLTVTAGSQLNMSGGTITGNTVGSTGVFVEAGGYFTMTGGTITGNNVGVTVTAESTLNMSGGTITGNNDGVTVEEDDAVPTYTLGGTAKITGNTSSNLNLPDGATVNVDDFEPGMVIGVTTETPPANGAPVAITTGEDSGDAALCFSSDNEAYTAVNESDVVNLVKVDTLDNYNAETTKAVNVDTGTAYDSVQAAVGAELSGECYKIRLLKNVTEDITVSGKTVALDLNGHVLTGTGSGSVVTVNSGKTLTLIDTRPYVKRTFGENDDGLWGTGDGFTEDSHSVTGGVITGGNADNGGGVYVAGTFNMYGGNIVGNTASDGGGVCVGHVSSGTANFNMYGGNIVGNSSDAGGGVYVSYGNFKMRGGSIVGNTSSNGGGGVMMNDKSSVGMLGTAKIASNTAKGGGGVCVTKGEFTMYGGIIEKNTATSYGGGIFNSANGTVTVGLFAESTISGNSATNGGGICSSGTLTLHKAAIDKNTASNGGGGIYTTAYVDFRSGTTVSKCQAKFGGGAYVANKGWMETVGGTIQNCSAVGDDACGGGVYVENGGTATFSRAIVGDSESGATPEISGCTAAKDGGGVYSKGAVGLGTATISGNTVTGGNGGGIYLSGGENNADRGSIFLGKKAEITGNKKGETYNNLYLCDNILKAKFGVAENLDVPAPITGMSIGVTTQTAPMSGSPVKLTENGTEDYKGYIVSDNADYVVAFDTDHLELQVKPAPPAPSGGGSSTPTVNVPVSGDKDSVKVSATVSGSNATVKNVTSEQLETVGTGENVTIDLSSLSKSVSGVTIPKTTFENVAASEADGLEVKLPNGTTAVFDSTTVAAVAEQAAGSNIQLVVDKENKAEQALTAAQKETVKALNDALVLDAYFVSNGKRISDFKGGEAELTVSYPTTKPVRVWYVAEDGTKELVPSTFDGKAAKFVVTHFSHYAIEILDGSSYAACPQDNTCVYARFTDANTKAWYHDGVHYCVENGYMQGVSANKFNPSGTLSRGMIVTMLWRMEGEPVVNYAMTFKDVPADKWYTEAIRWAQSTGVVDGYSADSFGPDDNVTREQLAAILYNYAVLKGVDTEKFTENTNTLSHNDVFTISDWATSGMHFCIAAGVVNGDNGMLYPQNTATRAQAASMMQRFCETVLEK